MGNIQRNVIYNVALSVSQVLFPLLVFPYVSRILGPAGIGSVSFVDSITQWGMLFAALGIPLYGVREIARAQHDRKERSKLFSELIVLHLLTTVLFLAFFIIGFVSLDLFASYRQLFWIGAGMLLVNVFAIEWLFQGMGAFPYITWRTVLVRILATGMVFIFVNDPGDVAVYYALTLLAMFLNVLSNTYYARRFVRFSFKGLTIKRHIKPIFLIFSFTVITSIYTLFDHTLLGLLSDNIQVGYYSTAVKLTKIVVTVLVAISTVIVPAISYVISRGKREESVSLLQKSFALTVFVSVPAALGLYMVAPNIVLLFAGADFEPAVAALRILAPSIFFIGLSNVFGMQVLNPTNNERLFFRAALVGVAVSLMANMLLIPVYRSVGAALAGLLTEIVVCILLGLFALNKFPFRPDWYAVFKALIAALPMMALCLVTERLTMSLIAETVVVVIGAVFSYLAVQYFVWKNPLVKDILRLVPVKFPGKERPR